MGLISLSAFLFMQAAHAEDVPPTVQPPQLPGGFGLSLGPSIIRVAGKPGETQQATVRVSNQSKDPIDLIVEVYDLGNRVTPAGELERIFPAAGTLPHSCASSVQLPASQITVEAGAFKDVTLLVAIPPELSGGRAAVVFFRGTPKAPEATEKAADVPGKATATVQIQPRIGVLVFVEALGTLKRTGKIEDFKVTPPAEGEPLRMDYVFENTGNVDVLLAGTFYMLSESNALAAKGSINSIRTFPGDRGNSKTIWEGALDPGRYHLVASFELGPDSQEVVVQESDVVVA